MKYIDCKEIAKEILDEVKEATTLKKLLIIAVGNNPASESYIKGKIRDCEYCRIPYKIVRPETEFELTEAIFAGNFDSTVGGIIIQLPLPEGWDEEYYTNLVTDKKDVDGFKRNSIFSPCTPEGIIHILKKQVGGKLDGLNVMVVGRGKLVGQPLIPMLLKENCTITVVHSKTKKADFHKHLYHTDVIISATGVPNLIDLESCVFSSLVIDAGINRNEEGKLCGDCYNFIEDRFQDLKVTPVPGGVGLLTRAMLMKHMMEVN